MTPKEHATLLRVAADRLHEKAEIPLPSHLVQSLRKAADELDPPLPTPQTYYVLYEVTWQPPAGWDPMGDDVIMDYQHSLKVDDPRVVTVGMSTLGLREHITAFVENDFEFPVLRS